MTSFNFVNKIVSSKIENKWANFFSTSSKVNNTTAHKLNNEDLIALNATLPVERYKFQSFPFHLVEQSP